VIHCATDLGQPLGAERGDEVAEVAFRERGDMVGVQNAGPRHTVRRSELDLGRQSSEFVVARTTKTSFRWSIASLRVRTRAGRLGQSGCSAQRTSPRFTKTRARPPAPRWPAAASSPRCSPHAAWRGRPIRRRRRRSQPHGERAQPAPRSNEVRVVGAFPSRSRRVKAYSAGSQLRPAGGAQARLGANHCAAGSRVKRPQRWRRCF
jgi:hypothetical protein